MTFSPRSPTSQQIVTGPFRALREIKDGTKVKEQKEKEGEGTGGDKKS